MNTLLEKKIGLAKTGLAFVASLALTAQAAPVLAQPLDGYLKIDGVKGESVAPGHKKWMQITGVSKLPTGCRGDEGGGSMSVRVVRRPDAHTLPTAADMGGPNSANASFEMVDPNGEALKIVLEDVFVSTTYAGSEPHAILVGFTSAEGAPNDQSDILTLNFKHVTWERADCTPRAVATR